MKDRKDNKIFLSRMQQELKPFQKYLGTQYNKTLYKKYRTKKHLRSSTQRDILSRAQTILCRHIGKFPSELKKRDIRDYEDYSLRTFEPNGNNSRFQALNYLLRYLNHNDWCLKIPSPQRKRYETLTERERHRLVQVIEKLPPLEKAISFIDLQSMCRPGEIPEIKIDNVRFDDHKILLEDSKTGTYIKARGESDKITMTPRIEKSLKEYLLVRKDIIPKKTEDEPYLFIHPSGKYHNQRIGYEKIRKTIKKIAALADIDKQVTPYTLKRTEITREFDRGVNPEIIRLRARHSNSLITQRYNHKNDKEVTDYLFSPEYNDDITVLPLEDQKRLLAQKALRGEMPWEIYQQIRTDLERKTMDKHRDDHVEFG